MKAQVDYLREIALFYDWLETNSISNSAIALWHALMHTNRKAGWVTEFTAAISLLSLKTGLQKDAIEGARNRLQQCGRIKFTSRGGNRSASYQIIFFAAEITPQGAAQQFCDGNNAAEGRAEGRTTGAQDTAKQARIAPPLNDFKDLRSSRDFEREKDKLLALVNEYGLTGVGPLGLDMIYAYLGEVETGVIELAIKGAAKKPLGYFKTTINNWIKEGKTTVAQIMAIPEKGQAPSSSGKPSFSGSKSGKPKLSVVGRDNDSTPSVEPSPEELELMLTRARNRKQKGGGDDRVPFDRPAP